MNQPENFLNFCELVIIKSDRPESQKMITEYQRKSAIAYDSSSSNYGSPKVEDLNKHINLYHLLPGLSSSNTNTEMFWLAYTLYLLIKSKIVESIPVSQLSPQIANKLQLFLDDPFWRNNPGWSNKWTENHNNLLTSWRQFSLSMHAQDIIPVINKHLAQRNQHFHFLINNLYEDVGQQSIESLIKSFRLTPALSMMENITPVIILSKSQWNQIKLPNKNRTLVCEYADKLE